MAERLAVPRESGLASKVVASALGVFAVLPIVVVFVMAFNTNQFLRFPPDGFSFGLFQQVLDSPEWTDAFRHTVELGVLSSTAATTLAVCAVLGLRHTRRRVLTQSLLMLPVIVPVVVIAFALVPFYEDMGLTGSFGGLVVLHTLLALPFGFTVVWGSVGLLDPRLELAALSLGASGWMVLRRITLPLLTPAMISSLITCSVISFDEVVATLFLSSPTNRTVPIEIWLAIGQDFSPTAAPASVLVLLLNLGVLAGGTLAARFFTRRRRLEIGSDPSTAVPGVRVAEPQEVAVPA
jgi:putative spermidine/putrescine transport system permease protein